MHESISREAFGDGALFALRHLLGKPPGLYSMEDLLRTLFWEGSGLNGSQLIVGSKIDRERAETPDQPFGKTYPIRRI